MLGYCNDDVSRARASLTLPARGRVIHSSSVSRSYLAAFIYIIARGRGMAERSAELAQARTEAANSYIRQVAGTGPAADIASAKALLDEGTITEAEYEKLKKKALA